MSGWTFEQIARKAIMAGIVMARRDYNHAGFCPTCFNRLNLNDLCINNCIFSKPFYFPIGMSMTDMVNEITSDLHKVIT